MHSIKPQKLKKGDTIGFLSASGDIKDLSKLEAAKADFEAMGYKVVISPNASSRKDYLAGTDEARASALNDFFKDHSINAILATRGGYGSIRLLDKIDYAAIAENPKIFAGYSDFTALMLMIYRKTGLVTFNAPMAYSDFGCDITDYSRESFFRVLADGAADGEILIDNPETYFSGMTGGILWGGNLSTVQSLCGQDFVPDEKFIFLAEDVNEPVYKIDKMFTQLLNIPKFKANLSGIVLGDFTGIDNEVYFKNYFTELAQELKIPTIRGLKFGHESDKQTIPVGLPAVLDTNLGKILVNY